MGIIVHSKKAGGRGKASGGVSTHASASDHVHNNLFIQQRLFTLAIADFNAAGDQAFVRDWAFNEYEIHSIRVRDADGTINTANGGIYTAANKGGIALAAAQAFAGITAAGQGINLTIAAAGLAKQTATPIFNLTTLQGGARTGVIEIWGVPLSEAA